MQGATCSFFRAKIAKYGDENELRFEYIAKYKSILRNAGTKELNFKNL